MNGHSLNIGSVHSRKQKTIYHARHKEKICFLAAILLIPLAAVQPTLAATPVEVTSFGSNPGNLRMFKYVPDNLPSAAPLVVVLHGCTQNARTYATESGWLQLADAIH